MTHKTLYIQGRDGSHLPVKTLYLNTTSASSACVGKSNSSRELIMTVFVSKISVTELAVNRQANMTRYIHRPQHDSQQNTTATRYIHRPQHDSQQNTTATLEYKQAEVPGDSTALAVAPSSE